MSELDQKIFDARSFVGEDLLGIFRLETSVWCRSLRNLRLIKCTSDSDLGYVAQDCSFGDLRVAIFDWDSSFGNFRLGSFTWKTSPVILRLRKLRCDLSWDLSL